MSTLFPNLTNLDGPNDLTEPVKTTLVKEREKVAELKVKKTKTTTKK